MTIAYMDLFYILSIGGIVAVLIMMEAQINQIKKMMEEHIKYDGKMCDQFKEEKE
jgi:uncharacterized membrane protein YqgA involved in biofilm formation